MMHNNPDPIPRRLKQGEIRLIKYLLKHNNMPCKLHKPLEDMYVIDLSDDGMGSLQFCRDSANIRKFGCNILEAIAYDADGRLINIALYVDRDGYLYELDSFTQDFEALASPLGTILQVDNIASPPVALD